MMGLNLKSPSLLSVKILGMVKKILIVEDEIIIGMALAADLEDEGYEVLDIVNTGKEAIKAVDQERIDLIILDIKINGELDGIETLTEIRKVANPHVIIISGNSETHTCKRIKEVNVTGFLIKPFPKGELLKLIKAIQ